MTHYSGLEGTHTYTQQVQTLLGGRYLPSHIRKASMLSFPPTIRGENLRRTICVEAYRQAFEKCSDSGSFHPGRNLEGVK